MKKILAGLLLLPGLLVGQQARQMARASTGFGDSSLVITSDTLSSKTTFVTKAVSLAQVRKSLSKFAFDSGQFTGPFRALGTSTLSGALTYGGVTLSNAVTGTGNMVLSASPTLTGTIAAAAATLSGIATFNAGPVVSVASAAQVQIKATGATTGLPAYISFANGATVRWQLGLNYISGGDQFDIYDMVNAKTAMQITAGANPSVLFNGALSGITTLAGTGAISGFTSATFSGGVNFTKGTGSVLNGAAVHITKGTGAGLYLLTALPTGAGSAFSYLLTDDGATTSVVALATNVNWTVAAGVSTDLATITNASGGTQTLTYSVIRLYSTF